MGNPFKKVGDMAKDAVGTVTGGARDVAQSGGDEIRSVARDVANEVVEPVRHVADQALDKAQSLEGDIGHLVDDAVKKALQLALRELQRGVLSKAVRILDSAAPDTASIQIGPVELGGINVRDRYDALRLAVDNPPRDGSGFKRLAQTLAPETVSITLSAELAMVVVSSDSLSVGMTMVWSRDAFLQRADRALAVIL